RSRLMRSQPPCSVSAAREPSPSSSATDTATRNGARVSGFMLKSSAMSWELVRGLRRLRDGPDLQRFDLPELFGSGRFTHHQQCRRQAQLWSCLVVQLAYVWNEEAKGGHAAIAAGRHAERALVEKRVLLPAAVAPQAPGAVVRIDTEDRVVRPH